jgi:hypothetical protein
LVFINKGGDKESEVDDTVAERIHQVAGGFAHDDEKGKEFVVEELGIFGAKEYDSKAQE